MNNALTLTFAIAAIWISTSCTGQNVILYGTNQKPIKKIKTGTQVSVRLDQSGIFEFLDQTDTCDQVELKGFIGKAKAGGFILEDITQKSYLKEARYVGRKSYIPNSLDPNALNVFVNTQDINLLTIERDRPRQTANLIRNLGLLTFFVAPLVSLNTSGSSLTIVSDTYLAVAGSGIGLMSFGAILMHLLKPQPYILKKTDYYYPRNFKEARLKVE